MQCCVQRFTLLEAIVDEQMTNEYLFLSLELKYRRSLTVLKLYERLKVCTAKEGFPHLHVQLLDSK